MSVNSKTAKTLIKVFKRLFNRYENIVYSHVIFKQKKCSINYSQKGFNY